MRLHGSAVTILFVDGSEDFVISARSPQELLGLIEHDFNNPGRDGVPEFLVLEPVDDDSTRLYRADQILKITLEPHTLAQISEDDNEEGSTRAH